MSANREKCVSKKSAKLKRYKVRVRNRVKIELEIKFPYL